MSIAVALTVAQGKRLIAKGVVASPVFQKALQQARILIVKGTTNAYVVEEVTGQSIDKGTFARGLTLPHGAPRRQATGTPLGDVLVDHGKVDLQASIDDLVDSLVTGDLILKGANALNYSKGLAGVLIGNPVSGTIGLALRKAVGSHVSLMVPISLEKETAGDILETSAYLMRPEHRGEGMIPVWSGIFTEIEALDVLCGVKARHIGSGGIAGAEGAVWLALDGNDEQLASANSLLRGIYAEPALS
jgi:hypothetical protein